MKKKGQSKAKLTKREFEQWLESSGVGEMLEELFKEAGVDFEKQSTHEIGARILALKKKYDESFL